MANHLHLFNFYSSRQLSIQVFFHLLTEFFVQVPSLHASLAYIIQPDSPGPRGSGGHALKPHCALSIRLHVLSARWLLIFSITSWCLLGFLFTSESRPLTRRFSGGQVLLRLFVVLDCFFAIIGSSGHRYNNSFTHHLFASPYSLLRVLIMWNLKGSCSHVHVTFWVS